MPLVCFSVREILTVIRFDSEHEHDDLATRVPEVGVRSLEWRKMGDLWIRMPAP